MSTALMDIVALSIALPLVVIVPCALVRLAYIPINRWDARNDK